MTQRTKRSVWTILLGAVLPAFGAGFTELQIHPGNGVATNVPAFGGAVNVTVNPGASGGGIVTLSSANSYYGSTMLGCGTLAVDQFAAGCLVSSVGASASAATNLVLGNGTLKYGGPAVTTDRGYTVSVKPSNPNYAAVLRADGDITFGGNVGTVNGNFIKSGTGTVTYASAGSNQMCRGASQGLNAVVDFKANGDGPTTGYSGFNVAAGKVVLGANAAQTNYFTAELVVGLPTTTAAGMETPAYLDFVGGVHYLADWLGIGRGNGTTTTAPAGLASRVTIYNGYVRVNNISMGYSANISGYNARPVLDVFGGTLDIVSAMRIGDHAGGHPTINLYGGTTTAGSYVSGQYGATDARVNILSNAVLEITGSCNLANTAGASCVLALNGGQFKARGVYDASTGGNGKLYLNGGQFKVRASGGEGVASSVQAVVATNGAVFDTGSYTFMVYAGLEHETALGAVADGGLTKVGAGTLLLAGANTYTGPTALSNGTLIVNSGLPSATALTLMPGAKLMLTNGVQSQTVGALTVGAPDAVGTWDLALGVAGGNSGKLMVAGALTVPAGNPLKMWLYTPSTGAGVSANGTYTLMEYLTAYAGAVNPSNASIGNPVSGKLYTFSTAVSGANTQLKVTVSDGPAGDVWINAAGGAWATGANWQGGTPVNAAGAVATFSTEAQAGGATVTVAGTATLGGLTLSSASPYTFSGGTFAVNNGGADAAWNVIAGSHVVASGVRLDGTLAVSAAAGATQTVSGVVAGSCGLKVNPAASGGGTVKLTGANTFAGGVATGCGTAEFASTEALGSAADDALSLVLGPGTLRYTGPAATWAGWTLQAGSGKAAILANDSALAINGKILQSSGSFIKSGAGTLTLQGAGAFTLGSDNTSWLTNAAGFPANGDSPSNSFGACNVVNGKMVWGESGQTVTIKNHLLVGLKTTTNAASEVTGEVEINGGATTLTSGDVYLGVYNGTPVTAPAPLHPRLTLNGGSLSVGNVVLGWDNRFTSAGYLAANDVMNTQPELIVNGGALSVSGVIYVSYHGSLGSTNRFVLNSGSVSARALYYGEAASPASPAVVEINGGSLLLQEDFRVARYLAESWLYLNGGVLRAFDIQKAGGDGNAYIFFNGGTFQPIPYPNTSVWNSDYGTLQNLSNVWVQAGGFVLDTSYCPAGYNYTIQQAMKHDPALGDVPDGGMVKRGSGQVIVRPVAGGYGFTGPVRVEAGILGFENSALCANGVIVHEGAVIRASNASAWQWVDSLTLGTNAAASGSVLLDLSYSGGKVAPFAVSNGLAIVSDVEVCLHPNSGASYVWSLPVGNSYTVLVCKAAQTLDVNKFKGSALFPNRAATFQKVPIADGGAYNGWQAIVMSVADNGGMNAAAWDATTSGGSWETAANWLADAVPASQLSQQILFTNAASANVPVTLADAKTLGQLTLASGVGQGYAFSGGSLSCADVDLDIPLMSVLSGSHVIASPVRQGQTLWIDCRSNASVEVAGTISGTNALMLNAAPSGGGTTLLSGLNTYTGGTTLRSGTLKINTLANGGQPSSIGASSSANANLVLGPGTLHYIGPDAATDRALKLDPGGNAGLSIIRNDHDVVLQGQITAASGGTVKTGAGTLRLTYAGTNKVNAANSGDINATAAWPANGDPPSAGMGAGFLVDNGKVVLGAPGQVNTFNGEVVIGAQDRGLGAPNYACSMDVLGGEVNFPSYLSIGRNFKRTAGADTYATLNIYDGNVYAGFLTMAYDTIWKAHSTKATLNLYGGKMTVGDQFRLGHHKGDTGNPPRATVNVYGGELSHPHASQGMTFGWMNAGDPSPSCAGVLNVFGGLVNERWTLKMANYNSKSWVYLHGGTLRAENITHVSGSTGESRLYFNGGVYQPMGSNGAQRVLQGLTAATVSTNGAIFDTAYLASGAVYTNAQVLLHDSALGSGEDGGLTKRGSGVLALAVTNAFTGPVTVEQGTLRLAHNAAVPDWANVTGNGVLDADGSVRSVPRLTGVGLCSNGTVRVTAQVNPGATTNAAPGATLTFDGLTFAAGATFVCNATTNGLPGGTNDLLAVTGALSVEGPGYIDFGHTAVAPLALPYTAVVMTYGSCGSSFAGWRARGTGYLDGKVALRVTRDESGPVKKVLVEVLRGGTVMMLR